MEDFMLELLKDTDASQACVTPSVTCAKVPPHWQGKHLSESHKHNISVAMKGRKLSSLHKTRLSMVMHGKAPWNKGKKNVKTK